MTAYNLVRLRVKPGKEEEFLKQRSMADRPPGARKLALVKTGERSYCVVGEWNSMADIVAARPQMIASLDAMRPLLEDLGNGLGVTDPVSGEAVLEFA
ncbi:MAG TPA: DUF718 domain-containing protein [Bauldia sp.]|nr:DUF718 domain-containing protein [Bauldia sp.]